MTDDERDLIPATEAIRLINSEYGRAEVNQRKYHEMILNVEIPALIIRNLYYNCKYHLPEIARVLGVQQQVPTALS